MGNTKKILVLNCGSSSIKFTLFDVSATASASLANGLIEKIGGDGSKVKYEARGKKGELKKTICTHEEGLSFLGELLTSPDYCGVIKDKSEIDAIGHRVVHGGDKISEPSLINEDVMAVIMDCERFAPLHNPVNRRGIERAKELFPGRPQVAIFDTAFHASIPDHARIYGLPYENYLEGVKKYGFHGTSHRFVALEAAKLLGKAPNEVDLITVHLGNGSSIAAVHKGKSIDTSMGFTPLEGLIMGTRCGDVDPAAIFYVMVAGNFTPVEMEDWLNKHCGMSALAGVGSQDMRDIWAAADKGNEQAKLALRAFAHRVSEYIGGYSWHLKGACHIVFTGGIGEKDYGVREMVLEGQQANGFILDNEANRHNETIITTPDSPRKALVIHTNEELMIAQDTYEVISRYTGRRMFGA